MDFMLRETRGMLGLPCMHKEGCTKWAAYTPMFASIKKKKTNNGINNTHHCRIKS